MPPYAASMIDRLDALEAPGGRQRLLRRGGRPQPARPWPANQSIIRFQACSASVLR